MLYLSIAMVCVAGLAWDFGRRWVAREHDAVEIASSAVTAVTAACVEAKSAWKLASITNEVVTEHSIALSNVDARIKEVGNVALRARDAQTSTVRTPRLPLTGSTR